MLTLFLIPYSFENMSLYRYSEGKVNKLKDTKMRLTNETDSKLTDKWKTRNQFQLIALPNGISDYINIQNLSVKYY